MTLAAPKRDDRHEQRPPGRRHGAQDLADGFRRRRRAVPAIEPVADGPGPLGLVDEPPGVGGPPRTDDRDGRQSVRRVRGSLGGEPVAGRPVGPRREQRGGKRQADAM